MARCAVGLFAKQGYAMTSVREIAEASGVAIGSIYRYVGSKEDILDMVIDLAKSKTEDFISSHTSPKSKRSPVKALDRAISHYFHLVDDSRNETRLLNREMKNLSDDVRQDMIDIDKRVVSLFEEILIRGCNSGHFTMSNPKAVAHAIVSLAQIWPIKHWHIKEDFTFSDYLKEQRQVIFKAISSQKHA